jgi:hypothetical protein
MNSLRAPWGGEAKQPAKPHESNDCRPTMKTRYWTALAAALTLMCGCIPSVEPFYRQEDVSFDQRLLGRWHEKGKADAAETWEFEAAAEKAYKLTVTDKDGKKGIFNAHFFKLKEHSFLDLIPAECEFAPNQADLVGAAVFPGHLLVRVSQIGPEFHYAFFNFDWLSKFLEKNPNAVAHHAEDKRIVLTASTRELQRFVLEHGGEHELFDKPNEMVRAISSEPAAKPAP